VGGDGNYPMGFAQEDAYKLGKAAWSRAFIQFFLKGCNCFPASLLGLERLFGQVVVAFSLTSKGGLMK